MDEAELVAALRDRDPAALEALVQTHADRLLRSATLLCGNETAAQDLVQDAFVEALRSLPRFRGQSSLHRWLHSILLNLARRYFRESKRLVYDNDLAAQKAPACEERPDPMDFESATAALTRALGQLSAAHREVVVLRYYEHRKIEEIAQQLEVSKGTVKSRLHYAIQQLETLLPAEMNLFGTERTNKTV